MEEVKNQKIFTGGAILVVYLLHMRKLEAKANL